MSRRTWARCVTRLSSAALVRMVARGGLKAPLAHRRPGHAVFRASCAWDGRNQHVGVTRAEGLVVRGLAAVLFRDGLSARGPSSGMHCRGGTRVGLL